MHLPYINNAPSCNLEAKANNLLPFGRVCCWQVVGGPAVLVGNSAGALAALQVAVSAPQLVRGLMLLDCSMR